MKLQKAAEWGYNSNGYSENKQETAMEDIDIDPLTVRQCIPEFTVFTDRDKKRSQHLVDKEN